MTADGSRAGAVRAMADAIASRQVSAVEAVEETLRRIDARDVDLHAVVALRAEQALADAREVDRRLAAGEVLGPLAGVPVLVKDLEDVAGMPTRQGSLLLRDVPAATGDGVVPDALRRAGAVVVGKTNLPEFAIEGFTDNRLDGPTGNPWNPAWSPGGSSGGSAAAIAAGMVPVATATDGGGSVRIPSAMCGLVGLKPTHGAVGRWPVADWIDLSTSGPMATTVDDVRLLLAVTSGVVHGDPSSGPPPARADGQAAGPAYLVVAERYAPLGPLPGDVARAFASAVRKLAALWDVEVREVGHDDLFGDLGVPDDDWFVLATAEHVAALGRSWLQERWADLHPSSQAFFELGMSVSLDDYLACRRRRTTFVRRLDDVLGSAGLLVTPTLGVEGLLADGRVATDAPWTPTDASIYSTQLQNLTGHPAVSVPAGTFASGLPFGLQLTAPRWTDAWLLDLAEQWESAHPWARTAPSYDEFSVD